MILNRYERMIAKRYLLPGKGEGEKFIFLVSMISLAAVALGVAALIIVMSVMNGFRAELFEKTAGLNGHAILQGYDGRLAGWQQIADGARKVPGVSSALPLIEQPGTAGSIAQVTPAGWPVSLEWSRYDEREYQSTQLGLRIATGIERWSVRVGANRAEGRTKAYLGVAYNGF